MPPTRGRKAPRAIADLTSHQGPFVTVSELASYWLVSRKQIYKQIESGALPAIRLGPRLLRIRTADALEFEHRAMTASDTRAEGPDPLEDIPATPLKMGGASRRRRRA